MEETPRPTGSPTAEDAGGGHDGAAIRVTGRGRPKTRRALLAGAAAGVAGIVGENVVAVPKAAADSSRRADPVGSRRASPGAPAVRLGAANVASTTTEISATSSAAALTLDDGDKGSGSGLVTQLLNISNNAPAMVVSTEGGGYVIYASALSSTNLEIAVSVLHAGLGGGIAVSLTDPENPSPGISVVTAGTGTGLEVQNAPYGLGGGIVSTIAGQALNYTPPVAASTTGRGPAVVATIDNADNGAAAVQAATTGLGAGVAGSATSASATGVDGSGTGGATGTRGTSDKGTGVYAASTKGVALEVVGKVSFNRSGITTIPAKAVSATVDLAGVSSSSMVLATLQQAAGSVGVANVVPASGSFVINLSGAPAASVRVAWLVLD